MALPYGRARRACIGELLGDSPNSPQAGVMHPRHLEYFLAIVETGSMTRAAERLYVAQPSLSRAIRSLEQSVGAPLFSRVRHGMTLTPAGATLVDPARQALRALDGCVEAVVATQGGPRGHLDIACIGSLARDPLARLVGELRQMHPGVTCSLHDPGRASLVLELVQDARCHIGLVGLPDDAGPLVVHELAQHDFMFVTSPSAGTPNEDGAGGVESSPIDLVRASDHPLIMTPPGTSTRDLVDETFRGLAITPRVVVECEHREAIVELVLSGAGATFMPAPLARRAADRGAVVHTTEPAVTRSIAVVHREELLTPAAAAFLRLAFSATSS